MSESETAILAESNQIIFPFEGLIDAKREKQLSGLSYPSLCILAELEEHPGALSLEELGALINQENYNKYSTNTITRATREMSADGLVDIGVTNEKSATWDVSLQNLGELAISQLKTIDPYKLKEPRVTKESSRITTSLKITEYLIDNYSYEDEDRVKWLRDPLATSDSIVLSIATELNLKDSAATRRLYDMKEQGHLQIEKIESRNRSTAKITNVGVTKDGKEWCEAVQTRLQEKEGLNNQAEIDEVLGMRSTIKELASSLGSESVVDELGFNGSVDLICMPAAEFALCSARVEDILSNLRSSYRDLVKPRMIDNLDPQDSLKLVA